MKKLAMLVLAVCGYVAVAVEPVAVWNGDFTTKTKGDYTLADNGNTVDAAGSSITISAAKGISIAKTAGGNIGNQASTVIIKYTNLTPPTGSDAQVLVMNHTDNTSYKDFIGAASISGGNIHGIWQNTTWGSNKTTSGAYGSALTDTKTFAFTWAQTGTVGAYFWMDGANKNGWSGLHGNLQVDSVWVGGPNESTTLKPATGMKVLAIAVFDSRISDDEIAKYEFPEITQVAQTESFTTFLTDQYQDAGWRLTLDQLKADTTKITGTMDGNYVSGNNVAATGCHVKDATDGSTAVVEFQMQIYQDGGTDDRYLKATRVFAKEQNGTIWLRAVQSGNIQNGTLGTEVTNWNGTLAQNATAAGYGVASVTVTYLTAKLPPIEPLMLVNFRNADASKGVQTAAVEGWTDETRHGEATIPNGGTLTTNDLSFAISGGGGKLWSNNWTTPTADYADGSYTDVFGKPHEKLVDEIKTSLGLPDLTLDADVYKTGFLNGGGNGQTATISGLTVGQKYLVYIGFGLKKGDSDSADQTHTFKLETSGYTDAKALQYVMAGGASDAVTYSDYTVGTMLASSINGLMLVRLTGITPNASGNIVFTMPSGRSGLNFLAVAKSNVVESDSTTIDISGPTDYSSLKTAGFSKVTLNLTGDATLTFDASVTANLTVAGNHNLVVKGGEHLTFAKVDDAGVTGDMTYEIGGTYTAADGLKNKIKAASTKQKFVFTGNATVDLGSWTGTLSTHLVFRGGSHTFKHINGNSLFGKDATNENPTVMAEDGATLNFYGHDLTGWSATINQTGIVRAASGSTIVLHRNGNGTFYYNQTLVIDPGSTIEVHSDLANNDFRMTGGTDKQMIYVMDQASDMTASPARFVISSQMALAKDLATGIGVYVGKNAKLQISGTINSMNDAQSQSVDNSFARPIKKTGAGALEVSGTQGVAYEVAAGSIGGTATIKKLTMSSGTTIGVSKESHLIVETQVGLQNPQAIAGALENDMVVITVPSEFAVEVPKATDGHKEYELKRTTANELRLVYLVPPSRGEGTDLTVTPSVEDGVSDSVSIVVPGLNEGDYAGKVTYTLDFGGEKTVNGEYADGKVVFVFPETMKGGNEVYRGQLIATFDEQRPAIVLGPVTVYQGKQTYVWTPDGELWVNETAATKDSTGTWTAGIDVAGDKLVVNAANGVSFTPTANPDYVEKCDSTFTVSINASEAVDAASDPAPAADVQGGVRIASVGSVLKLQGLVNGQWTDLKSGVATDVDYEVKVSFHYAKSDDPADADSVTYEIANAEPVTGAKVAKTTAKISTVEVADGTSLSFLKGVCQLDKAVVADVEVVIDHDETKPIDAKDLAAAQAKADKMVVAISDEVAKVVDATTYRGYFKVVAKEGPDGAFHAVVAFAPGTQAEIEEDIRKAMEKVVAGFETGSAEIAAQPGLYYGLVRGNEPDALTVRDEKTLAGADGKVTITITKPAGADRHFYRIVCSPTK